MGVQEDRAMTAMVIPYVAWEVPAETAVAMEAQMRLVMVIPHRSTRVLPHSLN